MPEYNITYESLSQAQINELWNLLQTTGLRAILEHEFNRKIADGRQAYDKCTAETFEPQRRYLDGLKDQAGIVKNTKPPQK